MSVDDRLREAFRDQAESMTPEVEVRLAAVSRRYRQGNQRRWAAGALTLAAAVSASLLLPLAVNSTQPSPAPEPTSPTKTAPVPALTGRYTARLPGRDQLAGRWVLRFNPDGTLGVDAPTGYPGVLSGTLFSTTGSFRTNLFQQDICAGESLGRYRWVRTGLTLTFVAQDDPCQARSRLLTTAPWHERP